MQTNKTKTKQFAIAVAVAQNRKEVPAAIACNRSWLRGRAVVVPVKPRWKSGTAKVVLYGNGREAVIIEVTKLDPRVKFIAVYVDIVPVDPAH